MNQAKEKFSKNMLSAYAEMVNALGVKDTHPERKGVQKLIELYESLYDKKDAILVFGMMLTFINLACMYAHNGGPLVGVLHTRELAARNADIVLSFAMSAMAERKK
jgi:hypothetical protein